MSVMVIINKMKNKLNHKIRIEENLFVAKSMVPWLVVKMMLQKVQAVERVYMSEINICKGKLIQRILILWL